MGVAGIILAVLAIAFTIIPTIGWILAILSLITGASLSTIGLFRYRKGTQPHNSAILGVAVNIAVIVIILLWANFLGDFDGGYSNIP